MRWQFWLIALPARIVDIWFRIYTVLLAVIGLLTVGGLMVLLALWSLGIRWGW